MSEQQAGKLSIPPEIRIKSALLLDNTPASQGVLKEMLASLSLDVYTVDSPEEAVREMLDGEKRFDLMIVDMKTLKTDKNKFIRNVRRYPELSQTPLILLARGNEPGRDLMDDASLSAVLPKPVSLSRLLDTIIGLAGLVKTSDPASSFHSAETAPGWTPLGKDIRILLVEDNQINQVVASEMLKSAGVSVDIASNGHEAVMAVQKTDYHLILMDIQMPVMDGYEATRRIRRIQKSGQDGNENEGPLRSSP